MRIALPQADQGLNDRGDETIDLREIEQKVKEFRQSKEFIAFTEKDKGYQKMAQQMDKYDKYWDKLFIDPIEVKTPHGKQWIQPQRTNNAMEQFFREENVRDVKEVAPPPDAVGMPVTRHPPHRSPHEVFPHGAPRLYSLPLSVFLKQQYADDVAY